MHGGDVYRNKVKYDFSINVNPLGMPQSVREAAINAICDAEKYPDMSCRKLSAAVAEKLGCPPQNLVFGNGASELILAFLRSVCGKDAKTRLQADNQYHPKKVMLPVPCFTGYEYAINSVNACIGDISADFFFLPGKTEKNPFCLTDEVLPAFLERLRAVKPAACIITNPNNPNGKLVERAVLEEIASACEKTGTYLLIDECFMELTGKADDYSFITLLSRYKSTVVLRAFTKTMAIPGLRLGYCVTSCAEIAESLRKQLPEWNVSAPAQAAGVAAAHENAHIEVAARLISEERLYLTGELRALGFTVFPSDANFLLFYVTGATLIVAQKSGANLFDAMLDGARNSTGAENSTNSPPNSTCANLYDALLAEGVLIRDCRDYAGLGEGFYRIAVRTHAENEVLVSRLRLICGKS